MGVKADPIYSVVSVACTAMDKLSTRGIHAGQAIESSQNSSRSYTPPRLSAGVACTTASKSSFRVHTRMGPAGPCTGSFRFTTTCTHHHHVHCWCNKSLEYWCSGSCNSNVPQAMLHLPIALTVDAQHGFSVALGQGTHTTGARSRPERAFLSYAATSCLSDLTYRQCLAAGCFMPIVRNGPGLAPGLLGCT